MSDLSNIKVNGTIYQIKDSSARTTLENKADKGTSLSSYGINDAYTKGEADANFLPLVGGTITGNILPNATGTINLGAENLKFKKVYADEVHISQNTLYVGETPVLGTDADTIIVKADRDQSVLVKTTGQGATQISSESDVQLNATGQASNIKINASGVNSGISFTATDAVSIQGKTISIKGTTTIENLNVTGTTTTVNSTDLDIKDNIITLNKGQTGEGVSAGKAGIQIDRGDAAKYQIIFDEADDLFKVGMVGGTFETIATRTYADNAVSDKAEKATTLAGYNISNAYTKTEVDGIAGNKVDVSVYNAKMAALDKSIEDLDNDKQDAIDDLTSIRNNAKAGSDYAIAHVADETGAQINKIETINVKDITTSSLAITDKTVTIDISNKSDKGHAHDDAYYTKAEVDTALDGKADTVHGNHVPVLEAANNSRFLRNDNTWADVTPENIGALSASYTSLDASKLTGTVPAGCYTDTVYTHPTGDGNKHVPATGTTNNGKFLMAGDTEGSLSWGTPTDTQYSNGTGLSLNGTTFNHSNSITAGTAGTSSETSGSTLDIPYVTYDAQGHITAVGTHTHTISGFLTAHQDISGKANLSGATFTGDVKVGDVTINATTGHIILPSGIELY